MNNRVANSTFRLARDRSDIIIEHGVTMTTLGALARITQGVAMSGRAVGARTGPWLLALVDSSDIEDDRLDRPWDALRKASLPQSTWTEKSLLRPYDVLVTARAQAIKVALVPPTLSRSIASSTLLIVRAKDPGIGLGQFLWYYLSSNTGRSDLVARITRGMTVPSLSARALAALPIPLPAVGQLPRIAELAAQSELAYRAGLAATHLRRDVVRDAVIGSILAESGGEAHAAL